jgi:transposase
MTQKTLNFSRSTATIYSATREQEGTRFEAVELLRKGKTQNEVAELFGVTRSAVSKWKRAFEKRGDKGLLRTARHARSVILGFFKDKLEKKLLEGATKQGWPDDRWTSKRLYSLIMRLTGATISRFSIKRAMNELGWHYLHETQQLCWVKTQPKTRKR